MTDKIGIIKFNKNGAHKQDDLVIQEHKVNIIINGELYISLMCLLQNRKELAVGFLFSEGIIRSFSDIDTIDAACPDNVVVKLGSAVSSNIAAQDNTAGKRVILSGFALGSVKTDFFAHENLPNINSPYKVKSSEIVRMGALFNRKSELFQKTGAVHSCMLVCGDKEFFYEDIGRHNAIDKIIGRVLITDFTINDGALFTSGRISAEILIKTAKSGIPILVSTSAPTNMAVRLAREMDMTMIGFARGDRFNVYSGEHRVRFEGCEIKE